MDEEGPFGKEPCGVLVRRFAGFDEAFDEGGVLEAPIAGFVGDDEGRGLLDAELFNQVTVARGIDLGIFDARFV